MAVTSSIPPSVPPSVPSGRSPVHLPLPDPGPLLLAGSRHGRRLPNMALVFRVDGELDPRGLDAEAARLAGAAFGLGRRLSNPRVPGARPRWIADTRVPPVGYTVGDRGRQWQQWLDGRVSRRIDPANGSGWRLDAYVCRGGPSWIALTMSHLYGTGRDFIAAAFGDATAPMTAVATSPPSLAAEVRDVAGRVGAGARGTARLVDSVRRSVAAGSTAGDVLDLQALVHARRDRDPARGQASTYRVTALACVPADEWAEAAAGRGGTPGVLQNAVVSNLVRQARQARGADPVRDLRLIVPLDLADRDAGARADATVAPIELTSACVTVPGGAPRYGDLSDLRVALKQAYADAMDDVARAGRIRVAPGVIDAMQLLPDHLSARAMFAVHDTYDGASSQVGVVPPGLLQLAGSPASAVFLLAYPLGSDVSVCSGTDGRYVYFSAVADPSRLGAGPPLADRLRAELAGWGLAPVSVTAGGGPS